MTSQNAALDTEKQPLTTGDIISRMREVRAERRAIAARDKELIAEWRAYELELLMMLDEQKMTKVSTSSGTASITEKTLPQVEDWDQVYDWIRENDAFYLLERRVAAAAYRELIDSQEPVPGISPYKQKSISLREK